MDFEDDPNLDEIRRFLSRNFIPLPEVSKLSPYTEDFRKAKPTGSEADFVIDTVQQAEKIMEAGE